MIGWIVGLIVFLLLVVLFLKKTLKRIPYPEHWIIDRLGKIFEKGPGYALVLSFLGIDKVYARIRTGVDYPIKLFPEEDHWIDLTVGGRVKLNDPQVWIKVRSPLRIAEESLNFEFQIQEIAEQRITATVNLLKVKEVLGMRAPKKMKANLKTKIDEMISESGQLQAFLQKIDVKYVGFTIDDFDFEQKITEAREEEVTTGIQKKISENKGEAIRKQLAAIGNIAKDLIEVGFDSVRAQETSSNRYQDHLAAEKGKLQKIVWQGEGDVSRLAAQWEMGRTMLSGSGSAKDDSSKAAQDKSKKAKDPSVKRMTIK